MTALLNIFGIVFKLAAELIGALLSAIVNFFSKPSEQFGSKIIAVAVAGAIGFVAGDFRGRHHERAIWQERAQEHAEAMEQLREHTADEARAEVKAAQEQEQTNAASETKRIEDYAQTLPRPATDDCRITDSDLTAAGVRDNGVNVRRNPIRLQRRPQTSAPR